LGRWTAADNSKYLLKTINCYEAMANNPIRVIDLDGNENTYWDDAVQGSTIISESIHSVSVAAGDAILDQAIIEAEILESAGFSKLAAVVRWKGALNF
jgi:hypothetical protein